MEERNEEEKKIYELASDLADYLEWANGYDFTSEYDLKEEAISALQNQLKDNAEEIVTFLTNEIETYKENGIEDEEEFQLVNEGITISSPWKLLEESKSLQDGVKEELKEEFWDSDEIQYDLEEHPEYTPEAVGAKKYFRQLLNNKGFETKYWDEDRYKFDEPWLSVKRDGIEDSFDIYDGNDGYLYLLAGTVGSEDRDDNELEKIGYENQDKMQLGYTKEFNTYEDLDRICIQIDKNNYESEIADIVNKLDHDFEVAETLKNGGKKIDNKDITDDDIREAIRDDLEEHDGLFTDDSKYDVIERLTGIEDIDEQPEGLWERVDEIYETEFNKEESKKVTEAEEIEDEIINKEEIEEETEPEKIDYIEDIKSEEDMLKNMWTAVCSNDLDYVKNAYNKDLIKPGKRYKAFGKDHSLIMGALRNGNYEMIDLLKSFGETIRRDEVEEYKDRMAKRVYEDELTKTAKEEDCTQASSIQGPVGVFGDKEKEKEKDKLEESTSDIVTSEDLNNSVNYEITLKDGSKRNVECFWSISDEITEDDVEEGENPDDYASIYYTIYENGEEVDGGIMITKEDTFDAIKLCKDLVAMSGYPSDIEVIRLENGDSAFEKVEESKKDKKEKKAKLIEDTEIKEVNPEDSKYYDHKYKVSLYPGAGVELIPFVVYANYEGQALHKVVAYLEQNNPNLLDTFDSVRDLVFTTYEDEYKEWLDNVEEDTYGEEVSYEEGWSDFATGKLGYLYVDATEEGATEPYFIDANYLNIAEIEDKLAIDENKNIKTEYYDEKTDTIMFDPTVEYTIIFEDDSELGQQYGGEFITEDKDEAEELFNEIKEQGKLNEVHQYFAKTWEWNSVDEDYEEGDVEVYYTNGDIIEESKEPNKEEKLKDILEEEGYSVYIDNGVEFGKYTPLGEDWNEYIDTTDLSEFKEELKSIIDNWDSEEMAMPFIERRGQNGVPDSIRDLLDDADWKLEELKSLLEVLNNKLTENKKVAESKEIPETFEVSDLKRIAQEVLPKEDIDTHDGDLYLRKTPKSTELLKHMKNSNSGLISTFKSQLEDGDIWYDIPFANWGDDYKSKLNESEKFTFITKVDELPELCYGLLPSDKSIIIIKKGDTGYYETDFIDIENPEEFVNELNSKLEVTPDQRKTMEIRSMNGNWEDTEDLEENFFMDQMTDVARSNIELGSTVLGGLAQAGLLASEEPRESESKLEEDEEAEEETETEKRLMQGIIDNLGINKYEVQKEGNAIKFRYNGKVYYAEPVAMYQADIFDDNHNKIGYGVSIRDIKDEVFTDYVTNNDYVYELVGGDYAGTYTREEAEKLPIKKPELTDSYEEDDDLHPRKELQNQFQFNGYLGPMWNGTKDGKAIIRYETQEVYDSMSK